MSSGSARPAWAQPDRPHLTRSGLFLLAAVLGFPVVAALVAFAAPRLAALQVRSPAVLAANHLVTLGWGTMIALGALHQLLPAAAGVRRDPGRDVVIQFAAYLGGVAALAVGFGARLTGVLIAGGVLVVLSAGYTLIVAAAVVRRRSRWPAGLDLLVAATACLGLVTVWGLLLAANWRLAVWPRLLISGLQVHLALGLVGWFGLLIAGASYYLLPRFAGLKESPVLRSRAVLLAGVAAVAGLAAGALAGGTFTRWGLIALGVAALLYAWDVAAFLRQWTKPAPDITRAHWRVVAAGTAVLGAGVLLAAAGGLPGDRVRWAAAGVAWYLLGWVTLVITGQAYKVTPFLMWYYRFALGMSAYDVPRLEAPYWPRAGAVPLVLLTAGSVLIAGATLAGHPAAAAAGGAAYAGGAAVFSYVLGYSWLPALWRVRRAGPIPAPP
ncbi:MAG: hypothetical protein QN210_04075 [Armatimonadota bacterium]|nr:hypothetical protein [Armatimonadota bacterium]MDR7588001.1 hypothetical protein [Armatimonadota bacterium]MDR7611579.1 hypothetical protein [Armatimonadota bacterium]